MNTSPEPVSNWTTSITEDAVVVGGLALAFAHPWLALIAVVGVSVMLAVLVWWVWRRLSRGIRSLLQPSPATSLPGQRNEH